MAKRKNSRTGKSRMLPGEWLMTDEPIEINAGRSVVTLPVRNGGDRFVQVGSHFHFFEANAALQFDRRKALGKRLNIPAGQAVRFDPGESKDVELVDFRGAGRILGFNHLVDGSVTGAHGVVKAMRAARLLGYSGASEEAR